MTDNTPDAPAVALLPCPNPDCPKSTPTMELDCGNDQRVYCASCGADTGWFKGWAQANNRAVQHWNTHPARMDAGDEAVAALVKSQWLLETIDRTNSTNFRHVRERIIANRAAIAALAPEQIAEPTDT